MNVSRHKRGALGFTLAEALVALSLLSILTGMAYSFYLFTHKQIMVRERKSFAFDNAFSLLESVAKNIRQSRATVLLDPSRWLFLTKSGDTASYVYAGDTLYFNKVPLTAGGRPIASFFFTCFGDDSLLDVNGDREVSFEEIDRDNDGVLSGAEVQAIADIRAAIGLRDGAEEPLAVREAIKNKLQYDVTGDETYFK